MHRPVRHVVAALVLLAGTAACTTGSDELDPGAAADPSGAFPVTVEHTFGATTVPAAPQRVVTVGFNEQDFALALGTTPVGVRDYLGYDHQTRPWAVDLLPTDPLPTVGAAEINVEAVAALEPDLILGVYSFMDEATYRQLSAIAPTVAESADHPTGATPWQEQTRMTGRALGEADAAQALVDEVDARFADVRASHPGWAGRPLALDYSLDGHYLLGTDDLRTVFFTDLGFSVDPTSSPLSAERLDLLDRDVLVVGGAGADTYADDPLFQALDVVADDRTVYLGAFDTDLLGALGFASPLSLPYALDAVVPALAAAGDDDPATAVTQPAA